MCWCGAFLICGVVVPLKRQLFVNLFRLNTYMLFCIHQCMADFLCWMLFVQYHHCSVNVVFFLDYDECNSLWPHCEQQCINTIGSFQCSCNSGYTLHSDGRSCTPDTAGKTSCCIYFGCCEKKSLCIDTILNVYENSR